MVPEMDPATTTDAERPLPPPPPIPRNPFSGRRAQAWVRPDPLPGHLTPGWRLAFGLAWAAIVAGNAAVWESSRIIGLSTWWLGADAEPQVLVVQLLPFYGPLIATIAAISMWRYLPYLGIAVALAGAGIACGDLGRVRWLAVVELVLAGAGLLVSVASLAGMYRPVRAADGA